MALVTFPGPGDGRYLVGAVRGDTLWLESSTLAEPGSWRADARAAFVRSQAAVTPFRRMRGVFTAAPPAADSAALAAGMDSLVRGASGTVPALPGAAGGVRAGTGTGAPAGARPPTGTTGQPVTPTPTPRTDVSQPVTEPTEAPVEQAEDPEPEPTRPPPVRREPPRVLGVPVERDTAGGQLP